MKRAPAKRAVGEDVDSCEKRQEREVARWAHYIWGTQEQVQTRHRT